jgi:hypothetical protein
MGMDVFSFPRVSMPNEEPRKECQSRNMTSAYGRPAPPLTTSIPLLSPMCFLSHEHIQGLPLLIWATGFEASFISGQQFTPEILVDHIRI